MQAGLEPVYFEEVQKQPTDLVHNGFSIVVNLRSAREIALMRRAGLVVWGAHQLARSMVRPGATTGEIDAAVEAFFAEHGAIPLFKGVPGKMPFPSVCCISVNEEVVHGIPGPRVLRAGDIISIDTGCSVGGWCGDSAFTHPRRRGVARCAAVARLHLRACSQLAIELMAVRNRWSDVASEMAKYVRDHGFTVVENFVGHGIGRNDARRSAGAQLLHPGLSAKPRF